MWSIHLFVYRAVSFKSYFSLDAEIVWRKGDGNQEHLPAQHTLTFALRLKAWRVSVIQRSMINEGWS